jgi:hypothetical protein
MPKRRATSHAVPEVEARLFTVEEVERLMAAPLAEAIQVPAVDATPRDEGGHRKRSRIREVFSDDPDDPNYVVCQCRENVVPRGHVCGGRLKPGGSTTPLWSHVKKKHPCTHARLSSQEDEDDDVANAAQSLASTAELSVNVSYQQMVVSLSHAPLQTLSHAIEALQHAKEQRSRISG